MNSTPTGTLARTRDKDCRDEGWIYPGRPPAHANGGAIESCQHERIESALTLLLNEAPLHKAWMPRASCRGTDPDLWHPTEGPPPLLHMCEECPVRKECFTTGLLTGQSGTWGGTSERLRENVRKHLGLTGDMRPVRMSLVSERAVSVARKRHGNGVNESKHLARTA